MAERTADQSKVAVSVLIPTRNEERLLPGCLASVAWADEIVVFDSHSIDRTAEIAREAGANVVTREFDSFARHKNWALDNIPFRHRWVLLLDADERVTPELAAEIGAIVASPGPSGAGPAGYYIARKLVFCGQWLRHGGVWPDYNLRLLQRGRGRYEDRLVHEHVILDGKAGYLAHPLLHEDDKGLERYIDRHNHYTSLEALEVLRTEQGDSGARLKGDLRARGPQRRRALKQMARRCLPLRPLFVFFYMYVLKAGFLDGRIGLRYCLLKAFFDYITELKLAELRDPASPLRQRYGHHLDRGHRKSF
jgi:glycosyltransferase involved in cell wall biosynthesis